jgi:hypothetical protein
MLFGGRGSGANVHWHHGPMRIQRTPAECLNGLPDFSYEHCYADVPDQDGGTVRMAYLDEGAGQEIASFVRETA